MLVMVALVAASCGGDDDDPAPSAATGSESSGADSGSSDAPAEDDDDEAAAATPADDDDMDDGDMSDDDMSTDDMDDGDMDDGDGEMTTQPVEMTTIRLVPWGAAKFIDFIDFYVAEENGYFADAGIIFEQLPGQGAGDAVRQVVAGNADIAMADPFSGFFAVLAGEDLEGFYCPYTKNWLTMLVNNAAGVNTPEDLRGKTIAVTSQASTSKWYAALLLAANGITEDEVTFAATGVDFGTALLAGAAQAASTWGSINWALFEAGGFPEDVAGDYEIWEYDTIPGPNDVFFAKRGWLEDNADLVGRFVDAIVKAKLWIEENPEAAGEIGSRYAVGADNMARNLAVIDYRIDMQNTGPGVADNGMGWCDVDTIQALADDGLELGIIESAVDVSTVISNRYIDN